LGLEKEKQLSDLVTFDTFDKLERRVKALETMHRELASVVVEQGAIIEQQKARIETLEKSVQFVSSRSKMDELAQAEYHPFGRPLSREDEEG